VVDVDVETEKHGSGIYIGLAPACWLSRVRLGSHHPPKWSRE
jgi:hypothetical protein